MFPIQDAAPVRWELAERAYHEYVKHGGRGQSLERLSQRGGFGLQEFACFYQGHMPMSGHRACIEVADAAGILVANLERERDEANRKAKAYLEELKTYHGTALQNIQLRKALERLMCVDAAMPIKHEVDAQSQADKALDLTPTKSEERVKLMEEVLDASRHFASIGGNKLHDALVAFDKHKRGD